MRCSMHKMFRALVICFFLLHLYKPAYASASTDLEQLILFVHPKDSLIHPTFQDSYLPGIRQMAEEMGLQLIVMDIRKGVPSEVSITPVIVFQNFRGRSIYQGRTNTLKRIQNFIRTARFVPQGKGVHMRDDISVWDHGRTRIWAPLKIAAVSGKAPDNHDHKDFVRESCRAIEKGFRKFKVKQRVELGRTDRGFYMDFYPWLSDDSTLFLSLALFSQFHCKKPVFELKKDPLTGPWKDRNALFTRAAAIMENAVEDCIQDPEGGDGFDIIPQTIPIVNWQELGLPLPPAPKQEVPDIPVDTKIPQQWITTDPGLDDPPLIQFRFPAPLDNYTGEVTRAYGEIQLTEDPHLKGSTGFIEADPLSVTMGESQLDQTIQGSLFLHSKKYPKARFVVGAVSTDGQAIGYGRLTPIKVNGVFVLKGREFPLTFHGEVEPVLGLNARPLLLVRSSFQVDLRDFEIEGADGPEPARYTLEFDVNLKMRAKKAPLTEKAF